MNTYIEYCKLRQDSGVEEVEYHEHCGNDIDITDYADIRGV